jgi:hypothetical protein
MRHTVHFTVKMGGIAANNSLVQSSNARNYSADTLIRKLKLLPTGSDNDLSIL